MRRLFRPIAAISAVLLLTLSYSLTACGSKSGHHSSGPCCFNGPSQDLNGGGYDGPSSASAAAKGGGAPAPNIPTADAGPVPKETAESTGGHDCNFFYGPDRSGLEVDDHKIIVGTARVTCNPPPKHLSVIITIYRLAPMTKRYVSAAIGTGIFPGDLLTKPVTASTPCEAGVYYLEEYGTGISAGNEGFSVHIVGQAVEVPGGPDGPCV